jgi:integrase
MVRVQYLTGARPGEICVIRGTDIDTSGKHWLYYPGRDLGPEGQHKTAHRGHQRVIVIGPQAQGILRPFLSGDPSAYLFSPAAARAEFDAERRRNRRTPLTPSAKKRRPKQNAQRRPGRRYTVSSYGHAIRAACLQAGTRIRLTLAETDQTIALKLEAFSLGPCRKRKPANTVEGWLVRITGRTLTIAKSRNHCEHTVTLAPEAPISRNGNPCALEDLKTAIPFWHPHQLRHTRATELRRRFGLEATQAILGHASLGATQVYAEVDRLTAERIMGEVG